MMNKIHKSYLDILSFVLLAACSFSTVSCSDEDSQVRSENDIVGCWTDEEGHYMYLDATNMAYNLYIDYSDNDNRETLLEYDAYYYEPGYNFLLYINMQSEADIYEVTSLSDEEMTWVWADNLSDEKYDGLSVSEVLGMMITQAQEGFTLDYSRTKTFRRVATDEFAEILKIYGYDDLIEKL